MPVMSFRDPSTRLPLVVRNAFSQNRAGSPRTSRHNSTEIVVDFSAFFSKTCHQLLALKAVLTASV